MIEQRPVSDSPPGVQSKKAKVEVKPNINVPTYEHAVAPKPSLEPSIEKILPEMDCFEVELMKDQQGLGITIAGYVCEKGIKDLNRLADAVVYTIYIILNTFMTNRRNIRHFHQEYSTWECLCNVRTNQHQ
jgi:hypothetical protein